MHGTMRKRVNYSYSPHFDGTAERRSGLQSNNAVSSVQHRTMSCRLRALRLECMDRLQCDVWSRFRDADSRRHCANEARRDTLWSIIGRQKLQPTSVPIRCPDACNDDNKGSNKNADNQTYAQTNANGSSDGISYGNPFASPNDPSTVHA